MENLKNWYMEGVNPDYDSIKKYAKKAEESGDGMWALGKLINMRGFRFADEVLCDPDETLLLYILNLKKCVKEQFGQEEYDHIALTYGLNFNDVVIFSQIKVKISELERKLNDLKSKMAS